MKYAPVALFLLAACAGAPEGRFDGLGPHARPVTTSSPEARAWFDQGLAFLYAFNHDEAIRSFERAAAADPSCAMAHWGVALANGPHINWPFVDEAHAKAAWAALGRARAGRASDVEKALIDALGRRYADPQPADRSGLDKAYADAMREVWKKHPKDADIGALFAEALMDLRPWDLWTSDGKPQPGTDEILRTLEAAMDVDPRHPLALHLYIHAVEASPEPGRADRAADGLRELAPGLGHLTHMPSHIDVRRGRWEAAIQANRKAIAADDGYAARAKAPNFYRVYMAHNRHMRAFAAMMTGQERQAAAALREMVAKMPEAWLKENAGIVDGFLAAPYHVLTRFGRWEATLKEPEPAESFPIARALRRFARATSLAALNRPAEARAEQKAFLEARAKVPKDAAFGNNAAADLLAVAEAQLEGEIQLREGHMDGALAALREGVKREDGLRYDEPPDWIQPVRHSLGAALLKAGLAAEAEGVYLEDLRRWPENGWSLFGLAKCLKAQGKPAAEAERRFAAAWSRADAPLTSSCLCLP
ncbi:MAG TPA: tetratricopeptide repeat protein [Planctomycetota bacterium]